MNKMLLIIPLLVGVFITASTLQAQDSGYTAQNNLRFVPNSDGFIDIYSPKEVLVSRFGFGVTGTVGGMDYIYTSSDFSWTKEYSDGVLTVDNNNANFNWQAEFDLLMEQPKITHIITNNLGATISDGKFWYIMTVPENTQVRYNQKNYFPSFEKENIHLTNLDTIKHHSAWFGDFYINFDDLLDNGFNLTEVYIGNGSVIDYPQKLIVALGTTKGNGNLPSGYSVELDPQIFNISQKFPSANGTIHNDWISSGNLFADDANYATANNEGDMVTVSNFSILEKDGGEVPCNVGAFISLAIEMQSNGLCIGDGGTCTYTADVTWNGGTDWTPINFSQTTGCGVSNNFYGGYVPDSVWEDFGKVDWKSKDLANGSFAVRFNLSDKTVEPLSSITCANDYISLALEWVAGDENNITHHTDADDPFDSDGSRVYHLAIANDTFPINKTNVAIYSPFNENISEFTGNTRTFVNFNVKGMDGLGSTISPLAIEGIYGDGLNFSLTSRGLKRRRISYTGYNGNTPETWFNVDEFTISAWVKREETDLNWNSTILDSISNDDYRMYLLGKSADTSPYNAVLEIYTTNGSRFAAQCSTNSDNSYWVHHAGVFNGTTLSIYRNGANCGNGAIDGNIAKSGTTSIMVGSTDSGVVGAHHYLGLMDELIFLNIALNSSQVLDLYNNESTFLYRSGYLEFPSRTATNITVNLTTPLVKTFGVTDLNFTVGNKSGNDYVYVDKINYHSGNHNNTPIGTPSNYSYQFWFYADKTLGMITPYMNSSITNPEPFFETFFTTDPCTYTGGNYEPGCHNNCTQDGSNIDLYPGANISLWGNGGYTLARGWNITGWDVSEVGGSCHYQQFAGSEFL